MKKLLKEQATNISFHSTYSYLKAVIGFSLEAFIAGHKPASKPTPEQIIIPPIIQAHGTTKPVFSTMENKLPTSTPKIIPKRAPNKLMIVDSNKN